MTTQAGSSGIQAPADGDFYKYGLKPVVGKGIMDATLKRLGTVEIKAMEGSKFVKPQSVMYELDGKSFIIVHDKTIPCLTHHASCTLHAITCKPHANGTEFAHCLCCCMLLFATFMLQCCVPLQSWYDWCGLCLHLVLRYCSGSW